MKKHLCLLLAAILLLGGLAGCGPSGAGRENEASSSGESAAFLLQPEASSTFRIDPKVDPPLSEYAENEMALPNFLDNEQRLLYQRAATMWEMFWGLGSFIEDNMEPPDNVNIFVCAEGYSLLRKAFGKYSKIEDFTALLQSIFTPLFAEYLLWGDSGSARAIDGVLYIQAGGRGGDIAYTLPDTFELLNKTDELVQFYLVCHYQDGTDGPAWTEKFPIEMDRTASGWRVSRFAAGNINGTEWQTCQDAIHGEPGWIK